MVVVDVGKAYNAVGFMNKEGKVLGNCAKLYNSREGFEQFRKMVEDLKEKKAGPMLTLLCSLRTESGFPLFLRFHLLRRLLIL